MNKKAARCGAAEVLQLQDVFESQGGTSVPYRLNPKMWGRPMTCEIA